MQYIKILLCQHVINMRIINEMFCIPSFIPSLSDVSLTLTAQLNLDQSRFKWSVAMVWGRAGPEQRQSCSVIRKAIGRTRGEAK